MSSDRRSKRAWLIWALVILLLLVLLWAQASPAHGGDDSVRTCGSVWPLVL